LGEKRGGRHEIKNSGADFAVRESRRNQWAGDVSAGAYDLIETKRRSAEKTGGGDGYLRGTRESNKTQQQQRLGKIRDGREKKPWSMCFFK